MNHGSLFPQKRMCFCRGTFFSQIMHSNLFFFLMKDELFQQNLFSLWQYISHNSRGCCSPELTWPITVMHIFIVRLPYFWIPFTALFVFPAAHISAHKSQRCFYMQTLLRKRSCCYSLCWFHTLTVTVWPSSLWGIPGPWANMCGRNHATKTQDAKENHTSMEYLQRKLLMSINEV